MSKELETVVLWRDGGGGLWMGWDRPERPWNWLTGTDASLDDLLSGGSRKVEECVLSSCYRPVWREFSFRKSGRF